ARLLGDGVGDRRVGVAEPRHGQPRQEVEVAPALVVEELGPRPPDEGHGWVRIGVHEGAAVRAGRHDATAPPPGSLTGDPAGVAATMVPTPRSVNTSSKSAWGTRPSRMWARPTPPRTARAHASTLGTMPELAAPEATMASRSSTVTVWSSVAGS